jgi:hypothetical protein
MKHASGTSTTGTMVRWIILFQRGGRFQKARQVTLYGIYGTTANHKNISPKSDLEGVECRRAFSRTKTVFNHIETVIRSNNLHPQGVHRISDVAMRDCTPIFDQAFNMVMERLYGSNTSSARRDELSIETIYNVIVKKDDGTIVKKRPKRPVAAVELEGGI